MDQIADKSLSTGPILRRSRSSARLGERGIEYVFANAGTDFAPIIEAVSRNSGGRKYPRFITVPHENVAMAMANGYYRIAGKPAAVMLHVTVGTANAICQLMNMARDNVPVLLCAGRTPVTETGHIASRNGAIHWGQESFDQGGMVREFVKWDYELRAGQPVGALVDRALDIAMSEPRGPVYLCLPREVLADDAVPMRRDNVRPLGVVPAAPSRKVIEEAAQLIAKAEHPLIITSALGRSTEAVAALSASLQRAGDPGAADQRHRHEPAERSCDEPRLWPRSESAPRAGRRRDRHQFGRAVDAAHGEAEGQRQGHPDGRRSRWSAGIRSASTKPICWSPAIRLRALSMLNQALGAGERGRLDARRKAVAAVREEMSAAREKMIAQSRRRRCRSIRPGWRIASTRRRRRTRSSSTNSAFRRAGWI